MSLLSMLLSASASLDVELEAEPELRALLDEAEDDDEAVFIA